jgi:putative Ca2+/H+ antiporter (TMEM165/GDT1 family)
VPEFLAAAGIALGVTFLAEFGDKSQLLALAFATRHAALPVLVGIVVAVAAVQAVSVAIGALAGAALPETAVAIIAGLAFLVVAAWTLRGNQDDADEAAATREADAAAPPRLRGGIGLVAVVAVTFFLGEVGDKTMLSSFALAARQEAVPTWIGATLGEIGANVVAVAVGRQLGRRLSPRVIRISSAVLFALAGVVVLVTAFLPG